MTPRKQFLPDTTIWYKYELKETVNSTQDPHKFKTTKSSLQKQENEHKIPPLAKKLFDINTC